MTRSDDVLFDSGNMGALFSFIADKTELNKDEDRPDLKLCNYIEINTEEDPTTSPENPDEMTDLRATINGSETLRCGYQRSYSVSFTDIYGNAVEDVNFSWNVVSKFDINKVIDGNKIKLLVEDDSLIGESFILSVMSNDITLAEMEVTIVGLL